LVFSAPGEGCEFIGSLGRFKVDASDDGEKPGSINVAGWGRSFFADASDVPDETDNDSLNDNSVVNTPVVKDFSISIV
jgi:hypothetical protein